VTSWIYLETVKVEHELRIRQSEEARQAALIRKGQGSPWTLKSLLARFGRI
jgi:hypothetical protein